MTLTDSDGRYTFTNISASSYGVSAEKSGYKTKTETGVVINVGETTTLNIVLEEEKKAEGKPGIIPGFDMIILVSALCVCIFILKRKRKKGS